MFLPLERASKGLMCFLGAGGIWIWISAELLESHSFCYYSNRLRILLGIVFCLHWRWLSAGDFIVWWGGQRFCLFLCDVSMKQLFGRDKEANTKQGLRITERQREILF